MELVEEKLPDYGGDESIFCHPGKDLYLKVRMTADCEAI